jgi:5-formyltetrahydrofolate cyclo-ligase
VAPHSSTFEPAAAVPHAVLKAELRRSALAARDALDPDAREAASAAIVAALLDLPALSDAALVAAYWPIRSEADPRAALDAIVGRGQRAALPQVTPQGLVFREWRPGDALVAGRFGLSEPDPVRPEVEPDALIVPLAAFDPSGQRIGYGRGYYDGAIARLSRAGSLVTVGVGFSAQEVARVPTEPHDRPLQHVVTEAGPVPLRNL